MAKKYVEHIPQNVGWLKVVDEAKKLVNKQAKMPATEKQVAGLNSVKRGCKALLDKNTIEDERKRRRLVQVLSQLESWDNVKMSALQAQNLLRKVREDLTIIWKK